MLDRPDIHDIAELEPEEAARVMRSILTEASHDKAIRIGRALIAKVAQEGIAPADAVLHASDFLDINIGTVRYCLALALERPLDGATAAALSWEAYDDLEYEASCQ